MTTEFNYVARLDTTQIMSGLAEIRSQVGMAFGSPTGFGSPAMSMAGGGFSGMSNVSTLVSGQFQSMFAGMSDTQSMFGGTFTNPAMAYSPHYGMNQAETSLQEEWKIHAGGLAMAQRMKPPGVSAAEYAMGVESNFINRQIDAKHAASMAAQSSFYAGVGGLAGGEAASAVATAIGGYAGGKLMGALVPGAGAAGKLVGGLAAGWFAYGMANDFISEKIENRYAQVEQIAGTTRELGELAGAGRGLKRTERIELGIAAREAARDLRMDTNEMGDVLALGRQASMLPTATDPGKAREQFRDFARTIEEGAQTLGSSLASATQVIKTAVSHGMTAQEGIVRAAGAGGADIWLAQQARMSAMGMAGSSMALGAGFGSQAGYQLFTGSMGAGYSAGLSRDEMRAVGGPYGAAQFVGATQLSMAASPLGNLQLMAGMGGHLAGASMMSLPGAAMEGLMAGGGDFMSNAAKFMVHQNEMRRGLGAGGIRTMARQQMQMGGEMLAQFMPGLSTNEAERMYAISMGMNADQAKLLVGGGHGGGGPGAGIGGGLGAMGQMRAAEALQDTVMSGALMGRERAHFAPHAIGVGAAITGAMTGAMVGSSVPGVGTVIGAVGGAAAGFVASNWHGLSDAWHSIGDGPGFLATMLHPQETADFNERRAAAEWQQQEDAVRAKLGIEKMPLEAGARFLRADVRSAQLTLGGMSPVAMAATEGAVGAMGLRRVNAGPGTVMLGDGTYVSAVDWQRAARQPQFAKKLSERADISASAAAVEIAFGADKNPRALQHDIARFTAQWNNVLTGRPGTVDFFSLAEGKLGGLVKGPMEMGEALRAEARGFVEHMDAHGANRATRAALLHKLDQQGGLFDPEVQSVLRKVVATSGRDLPEMNAAFMMVRGGAIATDHTVKATMAREASYLEQAFGAATHADARDPSGALNRLNRGQFYQELTQNHLFQQGVEALYHHRDAQGAKLIEQARVTTLAANARAYSGLDIPPMDPQHEIQAPGVKAWEMAARATGYLRWGDKKIIDSVLHKTTLKEQASWMHQNLGKLLPPPRRRRGPGTLQHAVGFGEQEQAMSSIKRSLEHVESSLKAFDAKVSGQKGATPQAHPVPAAAGAGK